MSKTMKAAGVGAVLSLKISLANAVIHLQEAAEVAGRKGRESDRLALMAKANDLGASGIAIRQAELALTVSQSLAPTVVHLSDIANEARATTADLRLAANPHEAAGNLINLNKRLTSLFT